MALPLSLVACVASDDGSGPSESSGQMSAGGAAAAGATGSSRGDPGQAGSAGQGGAGPEAGAGGRSEPIGGAGGTRSEPDPGSMAGSAGSAGTSGEATGPGAPPMGADAAAPGPDPAESADPRPWFTFFTTGQDGLLSLAPDREKGFGGNLGGLAGADEICTTLARRSNPGDRKVWRAFLSVRAGPDGGPVDAIDRIGKGPWHDYNNRLLAEDPAGLLPGPNERPNGADPQLAAMFTDEKGAPISPDTGVVDNHDMLTGSDKMGRLSGDTCQDWSSAEANGNGRPLIGHAWPRSSRSGRHWISEHQAGGCAPGVDTRKIASNGTRTVGAGGGYGGFYCFALSQAQ